MKLNQHDKYLNTEQALLSLTKTYFKTGDLRIKEFRDKLEQYLEETEYIVPDEEINKRHKEESEPEELGED